MWGRVARAELLLSYSIYLVIAVEFSVLTSPLGLDLNMSIVPMPNKCYFKCFLMFSIEVLKVAVIRREVDPKTAAK